MLTDFDFTLADILFIGIGAGIVASIMFVLLPLLVIAAS
jgi:hypothetical protein